MDIRSKINFVNFMNCYECYECYENVMNFNKFLQTPILRKHTGRLLLMIN